MLNLILKITKKLLQELFILKLFIITNYMNSAKSIEISVPQRNLSQSKTSTFSTLFVIIYTKFMSCHYF